MSFIVNIQNNGLQLQAQNGENLLALLQRNRLAPDAPCGGHGTCGKCKVIVDGIPCLACQTPVDRNMTVELPGEKKTEILTDSLSVSVQPDGCDEYALSFDVGTTTLVAYLMDGHTGQILARSSQVNPQGKFGADVISRIQHVLNNGSASLQEPIVRALQELTVDIAAKAQIDPARITTAALVGNTAMHHLLLGIDPSPLVTPPYMCAVREGMEIPAAPILPIHPEGKLRILPNIAGFVGADTVGCMASTRFDQLEELTLMIDIGTNGEMVLGNKNGYTTCSTAAGPAFEGAKIQCGMRGSTGAVDHVYLDENNNITYHVIGDGEAVGLCGSGLLDLVCALLTRGDIDETGRMEDQVYTLEGSSVFLSQKDVREVQLAKAAIRAGIELMCQSRGVEVDDIQRVYLAGAFGNYMDPASACAIGMIPPQLKDKIQPIGNAAGEGARLSALRADEFEYSKTLAAKAEFLELASMEEFNDCFVDCLSFEEEED